MDLTVYSLVLGKAGPENGATRHKSLPFRTRVEAGATSLNVYSHPLLHTWCPYSSPQYPPVNSDLLLVGWVGGSFSAESCLKCLVLVRSLRTAVLVVLVEVMEKLLVCVCVVTTFVPIQSMITSWRKFVHPHQPSVLAGNITMAIGIQRGPPSVISLKTRKDVVLSGAPE
jgi:hypothetical protein